jgi:hypothetical protein
MTAPGLVITDASGDTLTPTPAPPGTSPSPSTKPANPPSSSSTAPRPGNCSGGSPHGSANPNSATPAATVQRPVRPRHRTPLLRTMLTTSRSAVGSPPHPPNSRPPCPRQPSPATPTSPTSKASRSDLAAGGTVHVHPHGTHQTRPHRNTAPAGPPSNAGPTTGRRTSASSTDTSTSPTRPAPKTSYPDPAPPTTSMSRHDAALLPRRQGHAVPRRLPRDHRMAHRRRPRH